MPKIDTFLSYSLVYIYHVYLVVRQIFKSEIRNGSLVAVIATSRSVSALHKTLTDARGQHFFSTVIELKPPNHVCNTVFFAFFKGPWPRSNPPVKLM